MAEYWPPHTQVPLEMVHRIIQAAHKSLQSGRHLDDKTVTAFLQDPANGPYRFDDFAWSVMKYFYDRKLKWDDVAALQDHYPPKGRPVFKADWLASVITKKNMDTDRYMPRGSTMFQAKASFLARVEAKFNLVVGNVYYVTLNGQDFEYNTTLDGAKKSAMNALTKDPKGKIAIEVFQGKKHGGGGAAIQTMTLDPKTKKFSA